MALHKLTITVVDGGKSSNYNAGGSPGGNSGSTSRKNGNKDTLLYNVLNYNQTIRNKVAQSVSPTTFFAIQSGVNLAVKTAKQAINYYVSDIGRRTGDSNYQAMVNRKIEQTTDGLSVAGGMLGGAAAGSALGPVGAIIGAVIGAVSSSADLGFKYAERERAYEHEMFKENNSQAYNLARANYSALTGRVR